MALGEIVAWEKSPEVRVPPTWCKCGSNPLEVGQRCYGLFDIGQLPERFPTFRLHGLGRVDAHQVSQLGEKLSPLWGEREEVRKWET